MDEARELVAREQDLLELRVARQGEMLGVREDCLYQLLGVALVAEDGRAVLRMLVERRVDLVVEIVQERRCTPEDLFLAVHPRVEADRRLDGESVPQEGLARRVPRERLPRLLTGRRHGAVR